MRRLSGLDIASERQVRAALEALMTGKTVLLITHRVSSLREEDAVIVLDHGVRCVARKIW